LMQEATRRHGLDGSAHALLADLMLSRDPRSEEGAGEAFAALTLSPGDPTTWRRWGAVQLVHRHAQAMQSFERYLTLAPAAGESDLEVKTWMATLRRSAEAGRRD